MATKILTRDDFLSASKSLKLEFIEEVPGLDGSVYMREMSEGQRLAYSGRIEELRKEGRKITAHNSIELMALLVSMTVCDKDGNPLFAEEDIRALADNKLEALVFLSKKAMEVAGVDMVAINEVAANLKNARTSSSTTSSLKNSRKRSRK